MDPHVKDKRSHDRLIFNMGITYQIKTVFMLRWGQEGVYSSAIITRYHIVIHAYSIEHISRKVNDSFNTEPAQDTSYLVSLHAFEL